MSITLAPHKIYWGRIFCHPAGEPTQLLSTLRTSLRYSDNVWELLILVIVCTSVSYTLVHSLTQTHIHTCSYQYSNSCSYLTYCHPNINSYTFSYPNLHADSHTSTGSWNYVAFRSRLVAGQWKNNASVAYYIWWHVQLPHKLHMSQFTCDVLQEKVTYVGKMNSEFSTKLANVYSYQHVPEEYRVYWAIEPEK